MQLNIWDIDFKRNEIFMKKTLVLSGINLVDGGTLSVYQDCIKSLIEYGYTDKYNIIALVGKKKLFDNYESYLKIIEFPDSKKSWFKRLYYEYFYFKKLSYKLNPEIWISMHDMTPNIKPCKQYVYCHNPSQFSDMKFTEIKYGYKYYLFSKFYKYLYAINIKRNTAVIVQQEWIRKAFKSIYKIENIIVARPSIPNIDKITNKRTNENIFIYPSYPRYFKNFQVVCKAAELLSKTSNEKFKVYITIDGSENIYAKELVEKYGNCENIVFCGLLKRENLYEIYAKAKCLIFMSKLETFGMPILEFKQTNKPIILADLAYAHETIGNYDKVCFVEQDDFEELSKKMFEVINTNTVKGYSKGINYEKPFANNWKELFELIL